MARSVPGVTVYHFSVRCETCRSSVHFSHFPIVDDDIPPALPCSGCGRTMEVTRLISRDELERERQARN